MAGKDLVLLDAYVKRNSERFVRRSFWWKVRKTLGKVPFMEDALAAYFCAIDPATPVQVRAVLFGALAYFIMPTDMIPDFVAGLGFTDDATVLITVITLVSPHITEDHRDRARAFLLHSQADAVPTDDPA
ncbi:MAG: YkvA family protein [Alphaproteobacteria bacterium]|nr:YkvA family protein [Alphaproteobacteria bacterium]